MAPSGTAVYLGRVTGTRTTPRRANRRGQFSPSGPFPIPKAFNRLVPAIIVVATVAAFLPVSR